MLNVKTAADIKSTNLNLQADAVIVGSGAGGAVMAYELAAAGKSVILLEAGPYVPSSQFNETFPDMLELLTSELSASHVPQLINHADNADRVAAQLTSKVSVKSLIDQLSELRANLTETRRQAAAALVEQRARMEQTLHE